MAWVNIFNLCVLVHVYYPSEDEASLQNQQRRKLYLLEGWKSSNMIRPRFCRLCYSETQGCLLFSEIPTEPLIAGYFVSTKTSGPKLVCVIPRCRRGISIFAEAEKVKKKKLSTSVFTNLRKHCCGNKICFRYIQKCFASRSFFICFLVSHMLISSTKNLFFRLGMWSQFAHTAWKTWQNIEKIQCFRHNVSYSLPRVSG